ncbi:MAG: dihydrolipoamide acetyltransferase family protein [Desulfopila sp.]|jgi:pyruvate dehydrogenase E2 component (dihydrolipoamide acetyltransferase)|nr:dihydrolipoamide acetyltransferase family protein [Desulfopila sp.]
MIQSFRLPDLGEGVHEAEILGVLVQTGQSVREGDTILEVETDKAAVEIPSPFSGTIAEIKIRQGDIVTVGDVLITFELSLEEEPAASSIPEKEERLVPQEKADDKKSPVPAAPSTRRIAGELGVDLRLVQPTGANGVVTADDVRSYAEKHIRKGEKTAQIPRVKEESPKKGAEDESLPDFSSWGEIEKVPFRSIRRATANRMTVSWTTIPHVNCQDVADISRLEEFRQRHKEEIETAGGRLTMTVFALKAVASALKSYPQFNASLDLEGGHILLKKYYHIGVAVDTPHGLMVPVIRDVDRKSIKEISIELEGAISRARERSCSREEMAGGTFTITNAGAIGGGYFSAIINYPEVAILGLGQGRMQPTVLAKSHGRHEIVPRLVMPVVLCFDHRVADGGDAIRFQRRIIEALEDPDELFITMT